MLAHRRQDKEIKMQDFEKWWEPHKSEWVSCYGVAEKAWKAATERAAKIAEEPGWKCEDVCPDDCANAEYIAQKIRME